MASHQLVKTQNPNTMQNKPLIIFAAIVSIMFGGLFAFTYAKTSNVPVMIEYNSGDVTMYAGTGSLPTGFIECNGQAISRTTFALLFTKIGTTYGAGDGSTTFNVPDMRGRFPLGVAASGTGSTLAATGGNIDHVHSVDPPNTTSTASANITNVTLLALGTAAQPSHTHDVNITAFNSAAANPPFMAIRFMIKN